MDAVWVVALVLEDDSGVSGHINLPPLRERREDIVPLSQLFMERFAQKYHRLVVGIGEFPGFGLGIRGTALYCGSAVALSESRPYQSRFRTQKRIICPRPVNLSKTSDCYGIYSPKYSVFSQ